MKGNTIIAVRYIDQRRTTKKMVSINRKLELEKNSALNFTNIERKKNENVLLVEFLADTGVTEHLPNSRLIFKTFNKQAKEITCANKNVYANLRLEGEGHGVQGYFEVDKLINLENVICAKTYP